MSTQINKYIWKNRILLVSTNSYKNKKYIEIKNEYENNIVEYHKRYIKLITLLLPTKTDSINIKLIGFDGKVKKIYKSLVSKQIFSEVDKMPLGKVMKLYPNIKPKNLSLYANYNKKTSKKGLGYANKKKALNTLKKIKNKSKKYQTSVVTTMLGRAKSHPNKRKEMENAINIFSKWLKNKKKSKFK